MNWKIAVEAALIRYTRRHDSISVERGQFLLEELANMVATTQSNGKTPGQTVSRVLQELRDDGHLYFSHAELYVLNKQPLRAADEDVPDDVLDNAVANKQLVLQDVKASDVLAQQRVRRGADALRRVSLRNYGMVCAVCDVSEMELLVTSHVARWADRPEARGFLANAICFCAFHNSLFEHGYFTLSDELAIIQRPLIKSKSIATWLNTCTSAFKFPRVLPSPLYLAEHRFRVGL